MGAQSGAHGVRLAAVWLCFLLACTAAQPVTGPGAEQHAQLHLQDEQGTGSPAGSESAAAVATAATPTHADSTPPVAAGVQALAEEQRAFYGSAPEAVEVTGMQGTDNHPQEGGEQPGTHEGLQIDQVQASAGEAMAGYAEVAVVADATPGQADLAAAGAAEAPIDDAEVTGASGQAEQAGEAALGGPAVPAPVSAWVGVLGTHADASAVLKQLKDAHQMLHNASRRNVSGAARDLAELSSIVDRVVPAAMRRAQYGTTTAAQASSMTAEGAEAAEATAEADGSGAAAVADSPVAGAISVAIASGLSNLPGMHISRAREFNGTGVDAGAKALFSLTALRLHQVLEPEQGLAAGGTAAAVVNLHRAALAGSREAMFALADRYAYGHGVPKNETMALVYARTAVGWLIEEVEADNAFAAPIPPTDLREAWFDRRYVSPDKAENAAHVLAMEEDMAMRGSVDAQRRLAYRRLLGRGIEADPEGAFRDFEAGAAQGDAYALFNLGYLYLRGLFVPVNYTKAKELFEQAAKKKLPSAYSGLGNMYWTGQAGPQNLTMAYEAYLKGAALNNSDSLYNLGIMQLHGLGTDRNETRAFEFFLNADEVGHWKAAFTVGSMYDTGVGVTQNATKALHYFRKVFKDRASWSSLVNAAADAHEDEDLFGTISRLALAAEQGSDAATLNAAWMAHRGLGRAGRKALDFAARLYERAAKQGSSAGAVELAHLILNAEHLGMSRPCNVSEAFYWYQKAAENNNTEGLYYLGWAFHYGVGVERNLTTAVALYWRCIKAAGSSVTQLPRMVAPRLALIAMQLDLWLEPLLGPDATYRIATELQQQLRLHPRHRYAATQDDGSNEEVFDLGGTALHITALAHGGPSLLAALRHVAKAAVRQAQQWQLRLQLDTEQADNVFMAVLLGALALVLVMRHRQQQERQRQQQQQLAAAHHAAWQAPAQHAVDE